jgi:anti-anti-sigma factor
MEITTQRIDQYLEVRAKGRLDGYWADHLSKALEEIIRQGNHHILLNLSEVNYVSSMGIRVLVVFYKKLSAIEGSFSVSEPSPNVKELLKMVRLDAILMPAAPVAAPLASKAESARQIDGKNASFEVFDLVTNRAAGMKCRIVGDPSLLEGCRFGESNCRAIPFPETSFAVGLGAFGNSFAECSGRFGEFLAVAGAAAYQPSDGSNVPDFLIAEGAFVPELQVLYGAVCEGDFSKLVRFETKPESRAVGFSEIVEAAHNIAGADRIWMVCAAESAGMVGASLRRPPIGGASAGAPFQHPEVRNWLSFTTEPTYNRALVITAGVASRAPADELAKFLRPLRREEQLVGHFHAAAFSYRPLQRGSIGLTKTVHSLFQSEDLLGLLHLIGDDRDAPGVSESEFVRGACWVGAITEVELEGN